jgi:hypothetical protein
MSIDYRDRGMLKSASSASLLAAATALAASASDARSSARKISKNGAAFTMVAEEDLPLDGFDAAPLVRYLVHLVIQV